MTSLKPIRSRTLQRTVTNEFAVRTKPFCHDIAIRTRISDRPDVPAIARNAGTHIGSDRGESAMRAREREREGERAPGLPPTLLSLFFPPIDARHRPLRRRAWRVRVRGG